MPQGMLGRRGGSGNGGVQHLGMHFSAHGGLVGNVWFLRIGVEWQVAAVGRPQSRPRVRPGLCQRAVRLSGGAKHRVRWLMLRGAVRPLCRRSSAGRLRVGDLSRGTAIRGGLLRHSIPRDARRSTATASDFPSPHAGQGARAPQDGRERFRPMSRGGLGIALRCQNLLKGYRRWHGVGASAHQQLH